MNNFELNLTLSLKETDDKDLIKIDRKLLNFFNKNKIQFKDLDDIFNITKKEYMISELDTPSIGIGMTGVFPQKTIKINFVECDDDSYSFI